MREPVSNIDFILIGKYLTGEATADETRMVEEWRSLNPENKSEFDKLVNIWEESAFSKAVDLPPVNVESAWETVQKKIKHDAPAKTESDTEITKTRSIYYYVSRIAAIIIIGLLFYAIYNLQVKETIQKEVATENKVTETNLADNTTITLNENSKITYPEEFDEKKREVQLTGEAFFEVERIEEKPFVVHVDEAHIEVLGTSFNVRALKEEKDISVTVQEGKVRLADKDDIAFVILDPDEKGILNKETGNIEKYSLTDGSDMFWKTKTLLFRDTQLKIVFETLERVYSVEISTLEDDILTCELTGKFQDESVDEILKNIAIIFDLTINKEDDTFKITGNGC